jgi:hypothetical protein
MSSRSAGHWPATKSPIRDAPSGSPGPAQIRRTQLRDPATKRADRVGQPIRSAITVAGIRGNAAGNSQIRGS